MHARVHERFLNACVKSLGGHEASKNPMLSCLLRMAFNVYDPNLVSGTKMCRMSQDVGHHTNSRTHLPSPVWLFLQRKLSSEDIERRRRLQSAVEDDDWSTVIDGQTKLTEEPKLDEEAPTATIIRHDANDSRRAWMILHLRSDDTRLWTLSFLQFHFIFFTSSRYLPVIFD